MDFQISAFAHGSPCIPRLSLKITTNETKPVFTLFKKKRCSLNGRPPYATRKWPRKLQCRHDLLASWHARRLCQGDDLLYCNRQCRLMFIHQLLQQGFSLTCTVSCGPDESGNCVGARYNPQAPVSCQVGLLLIEFVPQVDERSLASRTSKNQEADNLDCKRQLHCHNFNSSTSAACETRMR